MAVESQFYLELSRLLCNPCFLTYPTHAIAAVDITSYIGTGLTAACKFTCCESSYPRAPSASARARACFCIVL